LRKREFGGWWNGDLWLSGYLGDFRRDGRVGFGERIDDIRGGARGSFGGWGKGNEEERVCLRRARSSGGLVDGDGYGGGREG